MKDDPIDRLLDRTLGARAEVRASSGCLGPDELAAWTEGTLPARERAVAEAHAAGCDRCLAVLAAMAKTDPPPAPSQAPAWLSFRWLAPLATAAVAVTAWIVTQAPPVGHLPPRSPEASSSADARLSAESEAVEEQGAPRERANDRLEPKTAAPRTPARAPAAQPAPESKEENREPRQLADSPAGNIPAAAGPPAAAPLRADAFEERAQAKESAPAGGRIVSSPDPDVRWRISGGTVERTDDGGRTWQPQLTNSNVELLAGAAPSSTVVWIVGRKGAVLLSAHGQAWQRSTVPDAVTDLVAVTADDDSTATVTTADGRRYRTTDAGRTWTLQESPAAPF